MSGNRVGFLSAIVLLFVVSSILMVSVSAVSNQEDALSTISEAEQSMAQAYEAVLDAERVGANVSGVLVGLNDAAWLLSEAHVALEVGDFEDAIRFSELASEVGSELMDDAVRLEVEANHARVNRTRWFIAGSGLGVSIVLIASLLCYRIFKRRYYRRLLKMRPRVG